MGYLSLTHDQQALLYLLHAYTGDSRGEFLWVKELHLNALIYYLITQGVFKEYDYAPSLITFHGIKMYAKISQEALWDLERFRRIGMVQKLKLSNKYYDDVGAYRLHNGISKISVLVSDEVIEEVENAITCGGGYLTVTITEHKKKSRTVLDAYLKCPNGKRMRINFFDVKRVEYSSKTYLPGGL
ncbi:hypothetical protein E3E26_07025 [Thermococcus sp. LS1]|uniref:hypothetical protein n=1 Tax=Thermococcus sp. LS1 TaxID=1638259 RepID=UPI001438EBEF|nr:hypothetical protein [Thermococcus sp. LS1]NJD99535.1 hypothetical protein [Thermococcus sp. LS1]